MSLILEALKKSEAERRVGQPPGLLTHVPSSSPARRRLWPWMGLLLAPALVGGAWWFGRASAPLVPIEPEAESVVMAAPTPTPAPEPPPDSQPDVAAAPSAAVPRPLARQAAALREAPPSSDDASAERESAPVSAAEGEPLLRSLPPPLPAPDLADQLPPAERVSPAITAVPPPLEPADVPAQADVPALRDIDAGLRADLPPLRASMHVYDSDPARRFVLIDGRRVSEGDVLGESLILIEIRRDGSVLEFRGNRFLLPRPG